jgi:uncharacterized protein (TIGR03083 family)
MMRLSTDRLHASLEADAAAIAALVAEQDPSLPIPTCPEWTLKQLATHVGRAHRWAALITRTRSQQAIPFRDVPDGRLPDDPAEQAPWVRAGARSLADAVDDAGDEAVWSFVGPVPASFWSRRMANETLVHRADADIAAGREPVLDAAQAADAIDEWLVEMSGPNPGNPDPRAAALPAGASLQVSATDPSLDGGGEWLIRNTADGIVVEPARDSADAVLSGPAGRLLLVFMRRVPVSDPAVSVDGDASIMTSWLDSTPF